MCTLYSSEILVICTRNISVHDHHMLSYFITGFLISLASMQSFNVYICILCMVYIYCMCVHMLYGVHILYVCTYSVWCTYIVCINTMYFSTDAMELYLWVVLIRVQCLILSQVLTSNLVPSHLSFQQKQ